MTPEQFAKLPAYAQTEIVRLRANIEWERRRAEIVKGNLPSDVLVSPYAAPIHLPNEVVRVVLSRSEETGEVETAVDFHRVVNHKKQPRVRVSSTGRYSSCLHVEPQASNVIEVWGSRL